PPADDALLALEVALLADRLAQGVLQPGGVDDGVVAPRDLLARLPAADVQLAGAVAALAADGVAVEDRLPVAVERVRDVVRVVAVAEQAAGRDGAAEVLVAHLVAGGQVPAAPLGVPGERRLEEVAVAGDRVTTRPRPGADGEVHLGLGDHLAGRAG